MTKRVDYYIIISEFILPPPAEVPERLLLQIYISEKLFVCYLGPCSIISECCDIVVTLVTTVPVLTVETILSTIVLSQDLMGISALSIYSFVSSKLISTKHFPTHDLVLCSEVYQESIIIKLVKCELRLDISEF